VGRVFWKAKGAWRSWVEEKGDQLGEGLSAGFGSKADGKGLGAGAEREG
jgi:hypothetical protein